MGKPIKQLRLDDTKLLQIFTQFVDLTKTIESEHNRESIAHLLDDMGEAFFAAPASGRAMYHNCFPGGLCEHSLRVYSIFKNLCDTYGTDFKHDDILIASLFHDLGKAGTSEKPFYVPKNSDWHAKNMGLYYENNPDLRYMPHAQRSLQTLSEYDVELSNDVYTGILIHDGQYVAENKPYAMQEGKFAILLSMADRLACEIEKEKWLAIQ